MIPEVFHGQFRCSGESAECNVKNVSATGEVKEARTDYRQILIDFADEVPGRQKAVIKRMPLQKINNLISVLHEFKEEARQARMIEILALMEKEGVHPEDLIQTISVEEE